MLTELDNFSFQFKDLDINVTKSKQSIEFKILNVNIKEVFAGTITKEDLEKDDNSYFYANTIEEVYECLLEIYLKKSNAHDYLCTIEDNMFKVSSEFKKKRVTMFCVNVSKTSNDIICTEVLTLKYLDLEEKINTINKLNSNQICYVPKVTGFEVNCDALEPKGSPALIVEKSFLNTFNIKNNNYTGKLTLNCTFTPQFYKNNLIKVKMYFNFYNSSRVDFSVNQYVKWYNFCHPESKAIITQVGNDCYSGSIVVDLLFEFDFKNYLYRCFVENDKSYVTRSSEFPHNVKYNGTDFVKTPINSPGFTIGIIFQTNGLEMTKIEFC